MLWPSKAMRRYPAFHRKSTPALRSWQVSQIDAIEVAQQFGNRLGVLPYSVILDRDGTVVLIHAGEIDRETIEATIGPLLDGPPAAMLKSQPKTDGH